ncbi:c-type cytochrome biogenesis protein CcmI [Ningiella sp. W23]|uniref:c-type cytochrome biogenesis protein CcmI n=1 Tax=Ningiella sp. W23 TaxID=3023715 RepID=UPI0037580911
MTSFYILSALLVVVASLFVVLPALRKAKKHRLEVSNANVVKQRMAELEQELEEGLISEKDKHSAVKELKLALVDESEISEANDAKYSPVDSVSWRLIAGLSLPGLLIGAWVYFDANQLAGLQEYTFAQSQAAELTQRIIGGAAAQGPPSATAQITPNDYAKFALVIRKRLRETPQDTEGWRLLGQVQMAIGRMEESIAAFEKALDLEPSNTEIREKYAQALMATGTEESLENASRQVNYLVSIAPENRDYRLLLTVVASQLGDLDTALQNFDIIKSQLSPSSTFYQSLVGQLISMGAPESLFELDNTQTASPRMLASGQPIDRQDQLNDVQKGTSIDVSIDIAPELVNRLPDSGFLIVFAQNADTDSKLPLAVRRMAIPSFPYELRLSLEDAMMPQMNLDNASAVVLTARISKDADVAITPGELQGEIMRLELIKGNSVAKKLLIDAQL